MKKGIKNVFENWKESSNVKPFELDKGLTNSFGLGGFDKDLEDQEKVLQMILEKYDIIKVYQKHLQILSNKYP